MEMLKDGKLIWGKLAQWEQSFYVYPPHSVGLSAEKCGYMSKASLSLGMILYCFREVLIIFQSFCILLIVGLDVINEIKVACGNQDQAHKKLSTFFSFAFRVVFLLPVDFTIITIIIITIIARLSSNSTPT